MCVQLGVTYYVSLRPWALLSPKSTESSLHLGSVSYAYLPLTLDVSTQPVKIPRPQLLTITCNLLNGSCFTYMGSEARIRIIFIYIQVCYELCKYDWAQLNFLGLI